MINCFNIATTNLQMLGLNFTSVTAWNLLMKTDINIDNMLNQHARNIKAFTIDEEKPFHFNIKTRFKTTYRKRVVSDGLPKSLYLFTNSNRSKTVLCVKEEISIFRNLCREPLEIEYHLSYISEGQCRRLSLFALNPHQANVRAKLIIPKDATGLRLNLTHYDIPYANNGKWAIKTS
jgi:hypothetical protein